MTEQHQNPTVPKGKRIALVSSYSPSLVRFRFDLIKALISAGHDVTAYGPEDDAEVRRTLAEVGCAFEVLEMARTGTNPLSDVMLLIRTLRALRKLRPDVVIAYTMKPVIYSGLAARMLGIAHYHALMTGMGYVFSNPNPKGARRAIRAISVWLYQQALRKAGRVFVYNAADEDDIRSFRLVRDPSVLVRVAGTGVNLERYARSPIPRQGVHFLLIARLLVDKGVREFAAAARALKPNWPEATFSILGPLDPNPKGITQSEIESWQSSDAVDYLGETNDVRPYLDAASVLALPSYYREGIPRSILEAMAKGRPVITSNLPGCADTVEDAVSGYLIPPRDAEALAQAMRKLLEDPDLIAAMGEQARLRAEQVFDIHRVNRHLLAEMGLDGSPQATAAPVPPLSVSTAI